MRSDLRHARERTTVTPISLATDTPGTPISVGYGPDAIAIHPSLGPLAMRSGTSSRAKPSGWRVPAQRLAWPGVQLSRCGGQVVRPTRTQVADLGKVSAEQPVGVLTRWPALCEPGDGAATVPDQRNYAAGLSGAVRPGHMM